MESTSKMVGFSDAELKNIRDQFPILDQEIYGQPLVYLDNAASSQKPLKVIDAISDYYRTTHSNVHRGVHQLSQRATEAFENSRNTIAEFMNAASSNEIVFTSGTTDAINLVSQSYGRKYVKEGDNIIVSHVEHHSNIVSWQMLCEEKGAELRVIPVHDDGSLDMDAYRMLLNERTRIVSVNHVSNTLGTVNPISEIIGLARNVGAATVIDGAQAAPHMILDMQALDCDFYAISGHKMYGPTGIGVLYGKEEILNQTPPWRGGGEMIKTVTFEKTTYNDLPHKFEAGTPHVEGAVGLAAAVEFMNEVGVTRIGEHERELVKLATEGISSINGARIFGNTPEKTSVVSFLFGDIHPYDIGALIDKMGVAVRTGHHCTEPLMQRYGIPGTVRASFAAYNTKEEVERLLVALERAVGVLS